MCKANAFLFKRDKEELLLEGVDIVRPEEDGQFHLISIFGEKKIIKGRLKNINFINHGIVFKG